MASPKPKPTALKIAQGNPGKRPVNKHEPQPSRELPPCPDWIPPLAKTAWELLVPELSRIGTLSKIDVNAFVRYCINLHEWRTCVDFLIATGPDLVVTNDEGEVTGVVPYPHTKRKRELEILLLRYEQEFGLTPSSRSKIQALPTDQGDELDELLGPSMKIAQ